MILYIDTTSKDTIVVRLSENSSNHEVTETYESSNELSLKLLSTIDKVLQDNGCILTNLQNITVNTGPGRFTATRIGVAVANALGFALQIKVNGEEPPIEPIYDKEPNITQSL